MKEPQDSTNAHIALILRKPTTSKRDVWLIALETLYQVDFFKYWQLENQL